MSCIDISASSIVKEFVATAQKVGQNIISALDATDMFVFSSERVSEHIIYADAKKTMMISSSFVCPIMPLDIKILQTVEGYSFETVDGNYIMIH